MNHAMRRRLPWERPPLAILFWLLLWPATATVGAQSDDYDVESRILPATPREESVARVRNWVFQTPLPARGDGSKFDPRNADDVLRLMDPFVSTKIAVVDQVCGLTYRQKDKLRLAARGDFKRLFDRTETIGVQLIAESAADRQIALQKSACLLSNEFHWLCQDDSLFAKTVERLLPPEQAAKFRPLKEALRAGCHIRLNRVGPVEGLEIMISRSSFADDDLRRLGELPGILRLSLAHLSITDAGMAHLEGLVALRYLQLTDVGITDAGLAHVGRLRINYLSVRDTKITDEGLRYIGRLDSAVQIWIDSPNVTDAGLAYLTGLSNLRTLSLTRTSVTMEGVAELQQALPRLEIGRR